MSLRALLVPLLGPAMSEQEAAWSRAEALLEDSLTSEQHAMYRARGYIDVGSKAYPGRRYRVDSWRPVGVYEFGRFVGAVCIQPREHLPVRTSCSRGSS